MKRSTFITWDQLRVGALVLVALGVLVYAVVKLGQSQKLFSSRYSLVAFIPNAAGLRVGGQVTVAGQLAGSISAIDFLPVDNDTTRNLRLTLEVDDALRNQVRANSKVMLRNQGLLGDRFVDITPGTPQYPVLRGGDTLHLGNSADYEQMIQQASAAMADVVGLTHDMRNITGALIQGKGTMGQLLTNRDLYDRLNVTLSRTSTLLTRLQNPNGSIGQLLDDPTLYYNLTGMVAQVDTLISEIHSGDGTMAKLLRDDSLYTNLVRITGSADSLVSGMAHANGTMSKLFTDDSLYNALVESVTHLNDLLRDIRRDPRRYTKGAIKLF
jgi:phospholipid/cholesterol/gamma-HCH transport system substrate-binding protein